MRIHDVNGGLERVSLGQPTAPRVAVIALALLAWPAHAALSQQRSPRGVIDALVTDTALAPLAHATANLVGTNVVVQTADNGRFRIQAVPAGDYVIVLRRLGHEPYWTTISVHAADTVRPVFMLRPIARTLDTVVVHGGVTPPGLVDFESRRSRGVGQFMTSEEIARLGMVLTSDVLRTLQSVTVARASVLNSRGFGVRQCPYRLFIDGVPIAPRDLEADLPAPNDLAGMEVYDNSATVPIQYATFGGDLGGASGGGAVCGVILFWTKR